MLAVQRLPQVLHSLVRRPDADGPMVEAWLAQWPAASKELWKAAPRIDPARFAAPHNIRMACARRTALDVDRDLAPASIGVQHQILQTLAAMR